MMRIAILCLLVLGCAPPRAARPAVPSAPPSLPEGDRAPDDADLWRRPRPEHRPPRDVDREPGDVWTRPHARVPVVPGPLAILDEHDGGLEPDGRGTAERVDDALDEVAAAVPAPPIGEVLAAAYAEAGLDRDPTVGWSRRARLAGLVPLVAVRAGRNTRWEALEPDVGYGVSYEVRATWRLDRLVFDGRELQASSQQAARRRERQGLAARVVGLYFAYRRAVASGRALRAEEAAVELDALTGGAFSLALTR